MLFSSGAAFCRTARAFSLTQSFRGRLAWLRLSLEPEPGEPGVHRIVRGTFDTWVIETNEMARLRRPILTLFSRNFLRDRRRIMDEWESAGSGSVLYYVMQQIQQFRQFGEEWIMQFPDVDQLDEFEAELRRSVLLACPPEAFKEAMQEVLSLHERLEGLSPQERLEGLSPEDRRRLKELLDQEDKQASSED